MTEERCPERIAKTNIQGWDFCNLTDKPCLLDTGFPKCDTWEEMKEQGTRRYEEEGRKSDAMQAQEAMQIYEAEYGDRT